MSPTVVMDRPPATAAPPRGFARRYRLLRSGARSSGMLYLGVALATVLVAVALGTLVVGDLDPQRTDPANRLQGLGSAGHFFGTDELGRDLWARTLSGFRWSCSVAGLAALIVTAVGSAVGILAASRQGWVRTALVRAIDLVLSLPGLVVAVAILAVLGRGFWPLVLTLSVVGWALVARVVYADALGLMTRDFVLAARLMGIGQARIVVRHVLPNVVNTVMVMAALVFGDLIVAESSLSFLGLGAGLGDPSLGTMVNDGRQYLSTAPLLTVVPGVGIALAVVAANLLGDGLAQRTGATREVG